MSSWGNDPGDRGPYGGGSPYGQGGGGGQWGPPDPYGGGGGGGYYGGPRANADGATLSLVLGILGLVLCAFCAPFAIQQGNKAKREIEFSRGQLGGEGAAQAGVILGWIGTVLLILGAVFLVIVLIAAAGSSNG